MELRQFRYFLAVAEEKHFTRAAERLGIATPSLSQQIQLLERDLNVLLLKRTKRSVELTDAGARFLQEVRLILSQTEHAVSVAKRAGRGEIGRIEISYVSSASCTGVLTLAVQEYRAAFPMVRIHLRKLESLQQLDGLVEGQLDISFLRPLSRYPMGISTMTLTRRPNIVALSEASPLKVYDAIPMEALANQPFIVPTYETELSNLPHTAIIGRQAGFVPRVVEHATDFFTIVTLVAAGYGVAIVPESCRCIQIPGVVYRPLVEPTKQAELAVAYRRDERAPAVKAFLAQLRRARRTVSA